MVDELREREAEVREQHRLQVEGINRHYQRMGSVAHQYWDDLMAASRLLNSEGPWLPETRKAAASGFNWILHEISTARHSIDLERREAEDMRRELQTLRAALRAQRATQEAVSEPSGSSP